jgi:hypothetical protein
MLYNPAVTRRVTGKFLVAALIGSEHFNVAVNWRAGPKG